MASEYDALLQEVAIRERGEWRTDEIWPRSWDSLGPDLAAALRASEARAEKAERERDAYRDGLHSLLRDCEAEETMCAITDCPNPPTRYVNGEYVCPEHAPVVLPEEAGNA